MIPIGRMPLDRQITRSYAGFFLRTVLGWVAEVPAHTRASFYARAPWVGAPWVGAPWVGAPWVEPGRMSSTGTSGARPDGFYRAARPDVLYRCRDDHVLRFKKNRLGTPF